ncbi:carbohydrate-binding protein [Actinomadura bangladeshensis]|uniref:S1 family peptidase n=1 Tax=Actinomadura bangladeshensis TaxID=453573 RepID=A0A6L9QN65_9ACTN|nr:carbohydrate-binding protein [Actinomadura bangladeshensis]NEA26887.1 S1 family peptidase [Actinomadura bangladeshensis]
MSHRRVLRVAVLSVGALGLAGTQGVATAQEAAPPQPAPYSAATAADVSPAMLKAMQRDLGLTAAQAKQALVNQFDAGVTAGKLRVKLGGSFAGSWISGKTGETLHVATTDAREAGQIAGQGASAEVVGHSLAELTAAKAKLDRVAKRHAPAHSPVWYVDVQNNRVVVLSSVPAEARAFAKAAGLSAGTVTVKRSDIKPRTYANLRGGDAYYINGSTRCSIGFPVTRSGQGGFVSAGHCGRAGSTTTGANQTQQGTFQGSTFPGSDYSYVATNSNWTPTALVNGYGTVADRAVTGSTVAQPGAQVCRSGSTTGWHCGTIQQLNTSVTYQEGTVYEVTQTNVCAEPGDSGGSFISGTQAQGMTSGGSGNCSSGGTTFFQPVNEALQVYGLTLYTGDSNPPDDPGDPGDPSGTWAAGTVYQVGDVVTYNGASYRCIQAHQAQPGWTPAAVPALWQQV